MDETLSDDRLWRKDSPVNQKEIEAEEELTELQEEIALNRKLKSKISKANEKLNWLLDYYSTNENKDFHKNKIQEIINELT